MYLRNAVIMAIKEGKEIYRESARKGCADTYATIKPTNTYETCILTVHREGKKKSCRNWNPTADDLLAKDWKVTTE